MKASFKKYILDFKRPSGTSRGVLTQKETWFIKIEDGSRVGFGECGLLKGLSYDDREDYEDKLKWTCENIHLGKDVLWEKLLHYPSIQFGVETAFLSLESVKPFIIFDSDFTNSKDAIEINGLVWMGDKEYMLEQIKQKIQDGYKCIKLKIGAINFNEELDLLSYIRANFSENEIELRVDANGAFNSNEALIKLNQLSGYKLHSIEQPIKQKQYDSMSYLCKNTNLPIALDEELIGVVSYKEKEELLKKIKPQFIIIKPSLVGGIKGSKEWITIAENNNIGWWITSALESNVGLNAIAQFTYILKNKMPQGLGTGALYSNNFESPLYIKSGKLHFDNTIDFSFNFEHI